MDNTIPTKEFRCYPNNKPWVTSDLKALLNERKRAFRSGDLQSIRESKDYYRRKLEYKLENNTRDIWSGMREITSFQGKGGGTAKGNQGFPYM